MKLPNSSDGIFVMIVGTTPPAGTDRREPRWRSADRRARDAVGGLFPAPAQAMRRSWAMRAASVAAQVAAVALGALVLLWRIPGVPPWDSLYLDDYGTFFVRQLEHPWALFSPQHGYAQVYPHLVAQLATYAPLAWVAPIFAITGAVTAAACGLFVYHASAGHVRSRVLRGALFLAILLLPMAPMEIADNTVNSPWYMLLALFWACLWRPRTRTGMVVAALLALVAAASTSLAIVFAPLLAARLYVLRRPRDQAVAMGWLAGCLIQLPVILSSYGSGNSPLNQTPTSSSSLAFYAHDVVLPSLGWRLSWWLQSLAGRDGASWIVGAALAIVFVAIVAAQPQSRPLVLTALLFGLFFTMVSATLNPYNSGSPPVSPLGEGGARYTALPIFLIEAAVIVGVDFALSRRGRPFQRPRAGSWSALTSTTGVLALLVLTVIMVSWIPDYRYLASNRFAYTTKPWPEVVARWHHECELSRTGEIRVRAMLAIPRPQEIPCSGLHFGSSPAPVTRGGRERAGGAGARDARGRPVQVR